MAQLSVTASPVFATVPDCVEDVMDNLALQQEENTSKKMIASMMDSS